ncbi:MAG: phospholipase, partial [Muribaculaceae bacterium]|nr:phospholipase [Muribaculaceae bacterium]
ESYTGDESEEFRDILLSMQPDDIAGWARSLQLRHISLPTDVRDELIMIVAEARQAKSHKNTV